jgi:hypothetical protein
MWLVDVGDAIELQALSPASLAEGYADVEVISKAPMCLQESASAPSNELFRRVLASCGFTANTQHTGNALRPWEYRESSGSMVALDSQTVGYDLTRHSVPYGDYFDKYCFCKAFNVIHTAEPCSGELALTRERLWLHATCGSKSVPTNWKAGLKTTTFDYIPTTAWHWPTRVNDMPEKVLQLPDQCSTDACEVDANGYCKIKHAIDRSCFCRSVDYNTCKGPCHEFEARIDFVNWLHDLCGNVEGWDGLPKNWRLLAAPMPQDLIPWPWSVKSSKHSPSARTCVFTEWKLLGLVLINAATLVTTVFVPGSQTLRHAHEHLYYVLPWSWFVKGLLITGLYLLANGINAALTKSEFGYDHVPTMELVLLWCSMPRLTWLSVFQATNFSTIASALFAESILQVLSASHLIATVRYGWEHDFYGNGMEKIASSYSAQLMYAGALMWLIVVVVAAILLLQTARSKNMPAMDTERNGWNKRATPNAAEELATTFNEQWSWLEERIVLYWSSTRYEPELRPSTRHNGHAYVSYGTLPATTTRVLIVAKSTVRLYIISVISMVLLWIAQWLFWAGFIGLSLGEYVKLCSNHNNVSLLTMPDTVLLN